MRKLTERFGLVDYPGMQDWELEASDFSRVPELLAGYEDPTLNDDDRFALMALIVASIDAGVHLGEPAEALWREASRLLRRDARLHATTLSYWSLLGETDLEGTFPITPFVRVLWEELSSDPSFSAR